ncbi:MAG: bifunctional phosphoribosylaminoimidazolecarboxamide formyltransferase/IMP cyclohydrolase [Candidatus Dormibacteraeota bacterium]|nr:bifunctional phosphoribosylaminoimidazolecarboxamide formyltransferase/IMP cyclohydrolase [Candidatus Dormibacteraeota bacterium]
MADSTPRRAILSVNDKGGLPAFARGLMRLGYELYSTGGTRRALDEASVDSRPVSDLTGFPEMLGGRIKTLHPAVHGGLVARRDNPVEMAALEQYRLPTIDLVCVNLAPIAELAARPGMDVDEALDMVDIGGPALIRSAASNYRSVIVIVRPERYTEVLTDLNREGDVEEDFRRRLAAEAFAHASAYDARLAAWLRRDEPFPIDLVLAGSLAQHLRYGENPHQQAAFYRLGPEPGGLGSARQLQGAELSFNNIQDAAAASSLVREFDRPAAAIIQHTNPCGVGIAGTLADAYRKALDCDRAAAVGGVVAFNRPLDAATAEQLVSILIEVVIAPSVDDGALKVLSRQPKVRLLAAGPVRQPGLDVRAIGGGFLAQTWDQTGFDRDACRVISDRPPTDQEWEQLGFAWLVCKHAKSSAIVYVNDSAAVGIGTGQLTRVEAAQVASERAGSRARGGVMASDAFFATPEAIEVGLRAGITAIIQPGGSMRDAEAMTVVDAADAAMVVTGERHYRH